MKPLPHQPKAGFTLVELMVAMTLGLILLTGFFLFHQNALSAVFLADHKNRINRDIRTVTAEMSNYARMADQSIIYPSFREEDRDETTDTVGQSGTGDFLLLVYRGQLEGPTFQARSPIERLVGYYRWPEDPDDPESTGPVWRFIYEVPPEDAFTVNLEGLIPSDAFAANYGFLDPHEEGEDPPELPEGMYFSRVLELSEGLARGRLFYNFNNSAVIVNGKIIHGNQNRRVTDTYNFTIATRSQTNQF